MNKKLYLIIGAAISILNLKAQEIKVGFQTGYGFYNMSSLTKITKEIFTQLPFQAKIISNYPAYHYYQPMIKFSTGKFDFGLTYLYQTTGARISSKDYSGEYRFDSRIHCSSPGFIADGILMEFNKLKINLFLQCGINFSVLTMEEFIQMDVSSNINDFKFITNSFFGEPGINFVFPWNRMGLEVNLGYYKEFLRKDFKLSGESYNKIIIKKDFIESDVWDGLRFGVTIFYSLLKKRNDNKNKINIE